MGDSILTDAERRLLGELEFSVSSRRAESATSSWG
jgi:hypothetical protein